MALSESPELVGFDAEAAVAAGRDVAGDSLLTAVEFTASEFHPLYVVDDILAMYENRAHMDAHFDEIQSYYRVDREERTLFERELATAGTVRYLVTRMSHAALVRLYEPVEDEGLWVTLASDAPVQDCADAMWEAAIDREPDSDSPYAPDTADS